MKHNIITLLLLLLYFCQGMRANQVYLSDLNLDNVVTGWGTIHENKSIGGNPLKMKGVTYQRGIGFHAPGHIYVKLNGSASRFRAKLGHDDEIIGGDGYGNFDYAIIKDGKKTVLSGTCDHKDPTAVDIDIDVSGWQYLSIVITNGKDENWSDHVDLVNPWIEYTGETPSLVTTIGVVPDIHEDFVYLGDLDIAQIKNGWGKSSWNKSIGNNPLMLKGVKYDNGLGVHGPVDVIIDLQGSDATRFTTLLGIDDEAESGNQQGDCLYTILKDGKYTIQAGRLQRTDPKAVALNINVKGWRYLVIRIENGVGNNGNDHVDLAEAKIFYDISKKLPTLLRTANFKIRPTCQTTFYSLPNVRLMNKFRVSDNDATIAVEGLPAGLTFDARRKLVQGVIPTEGTYHYTLTATTSLDTLVQKITLIVTSNMVSPTPAMSWISWNVYDYKVNEEKILRTADNLKRLGLADLGWNYIVIDDAWQAGNDNSKHREKDGTPKPDPTKFPHGMKYITDYIHNLGLKAGIYSDAALSTCGGYIASYGRETIDANAFAKWGFDFLKYDYCNAPQDSATAKVRYTAIRKALDATGRPFFLNVCEWGHFQPWEWAASVGGNQWRMSDDIRDCWQHPDRSGSLLGFIQVLDKNKQLAYYSGPNHFNDMDMMCVGLYGKGSPSSTHGLNNTQKGMTTQEYQSQFSMWAMLAAPLTLSFELANINTDTKTILSNKEVIAINQDLMGQQAICLNPDATVEVYVKDLENGDIAVALLNRGQTETNGSFSLADVFLDTSRSYTVRDLWKHSTVATLSDGAFSTRILPHETKVYRLTPVQNPASIAPLNGQETEIHTDGSTITINFPIQGIRKSISLFNLIGKVVATYNTTDSALHINTHGLERGVYFVRTICNGIAQSKKVILGLK